MSTKLHLKSLDEWNSERSVRTPIAERDVPNGIMCPKCGAELHDEDRSLRCPSIPPQFKMRCPSCDFVGFRHV
jgi:hypothetical protein